MTRLSKNLSAAYSSITTKYSFFEEKRIKSWLLLLPGAGCAYQRQTGGCTMCGFHLATDKYSKGRLYPGIVFRAMFSVAQKAIKDELPSELFIFNGGSFFNDREIPDKFRRYLFQEVAKNSHLKRLIVESRCEYITSEKIMAANHALNNKKLVVGIGLESQDDYIRNTVIKKGLTRTMFEKKVAMLKQYRVDVLAYVFLKPSGLSEAEAYRETINTIKYALSVGVKEIALSCAFVQAGTKMAEDFYQGNFQPPYLWTILDIIAEIKANDWPVFIGGFSDEPPPLAIPANCPDCSPLIYAAIEKFRHNRILGDIPDCACRKEWQKLF